VSPSLPQLLDPQHAAVAPPVAPPVGARGLDPSVGVAVPDAAAQPVALLYCLRPHDPQTGTWWSSAGVVGTAVVDLQKRVQKGIKMQDDLADKYHDPSHRCLHSNNKQTYDHITMLSTRRRSALIHLEASAGAHARLVISASRRQPER
jgi:hypothetical protein